jgi:hypothetical protein
MAIGSIGLLESRSLMVGNIARSFSPDVPQEVLTAAARTRLAHSALGFPNDLSSLATLKTLFYMPCTANAI